VPTIPTAGRYARVTEQHQRQQAGGRDGDVVLLKDQDRSLWDDVLIAEGQALVLSCLRRRRLGPFQLQAAIQALHCAASRYEDTDWTAIVRFYDRLLRLMPTPVVALNRAIAIAETEGPETGLLLLAEVADLADYYPLHAARAHMLHRLGRTTEAATAYAHAADLARTEPAKRFLRQQSESLQRGE
jgi:RNA polymerase sigma-70 factor (ECF subfamily)